MLDVDILVSNFRQFLVGLQKCGKGNWKQIAREFVVTKTQTQVASHAQKYHNRQNLSQGGKNNKKRASIHDITDPHNWV